MSYRVQDIIPPMDIPLPCLQYLNVEKINFITIFIFTLIKSQYH